MSLFPTDKTIQKVPINAGEAWYYPQFLTDSEQPSLLTHLWESYHSEQPELTVFGKTYPIPRLAAWVADPEVGYDYSGVKHEIQGWTPKLWVIKEKIESETGFPFNSVLLNAYRNGYDKMGWHSDNEKALGNDRVIVSLNIGTGRRFDLRNMENSEDEVKLQLEPGSLLLMGKGVQTHYKHQVPQQKRVEGLRINLTFRHVEHPVFR